MIYFFRMIINLIFIIVLLLAYSTLSWTFEIYKIKENKGIQSNKQFFGISNSWRLECKVQTSGRGEGSKSCRIEPTDGKYYPKAGHYMTTGKGVKLFIFNKKNSRYGPSLSVKCYGLPLFGTTMKLKIGNKEFVKLVTNKSLGREWHGSEADEMIPYFIKYSKLYYEYIDGNRKINKGTQSLIGFTKAWEYAVQFSGYEK